MPCLEVTAVADHHGLEMSCAYSRILFLDNEGINFHGKMYKERL